MKNIIFANLFMLFCISSKAQSIQISDLSASVGIWKDKIVEFNKISEGGFTFVTEIEGEDGNDHKKAILRHTYILKTNTFSAVKEIKFDGTDKWIRRNEYLLNLIK